MMYSSPQPKARDRVAHGAENRMEIGVDFVRSAVNEGVVGCLLISNRESKRVRRAAGPAHSECLGIPVGFIIGNPRQEKVVFAVVHVAVIQVAGIPASPKDSRACRYT